MTRSICKLGLLALLPVLGCGQAIAAEAVANFTGPLLTPSASNLPAGTVVVEPYLIYNGKPLCRFSWASLIASRYR